MKSIELAGRAIRVVFERVGDRWQHALEVRAAGAWRRAWHSLEGTSDQPWPASPPLQDLHAQRQPDGRTVILAVGRAGRSHWSTSVELDADGAALTFDVACRHVEPATQLSSAYQASAGEMHDALRFEVAAETYLKAIATGEVRLGPAPQVAPATSRWKYTVSARIDETAV